MKKIFLLLCLCLTAFGCHKPKQKKTPPMLSRLPLERVQSEEMVQYIAEFPKNAYQPTYVSKQGFFYLDSIKDCIKSRLRKGVAWEYKLAKLMKEKIPLNSTVLDIGAHIGTHTLALSQAVGPMGKVIAFEPQPKIFRELFMNMALNGASNIDFHWAAVGDHEGKIELSLLQEGNEGGTSLCGGTGKFVPLVTVDSLHLQDVSLMKIDVEGMENSVLEGAKETILRTKPVIFIEICGGIDLHRATPEQLVEIQKTLEKLKSFNYTVFHIESHNYLAVPS